MPKTYTEAEFAAASQARDQEMMFLVRRIHALRHLLEEVDGVLDRQLYDDEYARQCRHAGLDIPKDCEHHVVITEDLRQRIASEMQPDDRAVSPMKVI